MMSDDWVIEDLDGIREGQYIKIDCPFPQVVESIPPSSAHPYGGMIVSGPDGKMCTVYFKNRSKLGDDGVMRHFELDDNNVEIEL